MTHYCNVSSIVSLLTVTRKRQTSRKNISHISYILRKSFRLYTFRETYISGFELEGVVDFAGCT